MNSFEEVFASVKKYCLENGKIPEIGLTTWIETLIPVSFNGSDAVFRVETEFQKDHLLKADCDYLQGFLFSPPIPVEAFVKKYAVH